MAGEVAAEVAGDGSEGYPAVCSAGYQGDGSTGYLMKGAMAERVHRTGQGAGCLWREV